MLFSSRIPSIKWKAFYFKKFPKIRASKLLIFSEFYRENFSRKKLKSIVNFDNFLIICLSKYDWDVYLICYSKNKLSHHLHSFTNLTTSYHKSQEFSLFSSRSSLGTAGFHSNRE